MKCAKVEMVELSTVLFRSPLGILMRSSSLEESHLSTSSTFPAPALMNSSWMKVEISSNSLFTCWRPLTYRTKIGFRIALRPVFFYFWRDFGDLEVVSPDRHAAFCFRKVIGYHTNYTMPWP